MKKLLFITLMFYVSLTYASWNRLMTKKFFKSMAAELYVDFPKDHIEPYEKNEIFNRFADTMADNWEEDCPKTLDSLRRYAGFDSIVGQFPNCPDYAKRSKYNPLIKDSVVVPPGVRKAIFELLKRAMTGKAVEQLNDEMTNLGRARDESINHLLEIQERDTAARRAQHNAERKTEEGARRAQHNSEKGTRRAQQDAEKRVQYDAERRAKELRQWARDRKDREGDILSVRERQAYKEAKQGPAGPDSGGGRYGDEMLSN